ncbi:MAG: NAD(P)-dependent glycerol-3-phosphate dehydrogenase [Alphaproteobacteria bacterium]|nr:NAD(P)-dependent glycerol-3-phosphate dehydrogenase [Alphaproteobacteria bacterium]
MKRLAVIGAGAWGTALAIVAVRAGIQVALWGRDATIVEAIATRHENPLYLPSIPLDPAITATSDLTAALDDADGVLIVVPAQFVRGILNRLAPLVPPRRPLLLCAKGIETESLQTMSEIAVEIIPAAPVAVLSGPTFAGEVARGLPAAVAIASRNRTVAQSFVTALGTGRFRPYLSDDPIGVEIGGAVKNVLAIACGIIEGRGLGDNARAALITRGIAEIVRLGSAKRAEPDTFRGLSGLGDLVLTCTAGQSRNYTLGVALGRGATLASALSGRRAVVEGVATAAAVARLATRLRIEMPVTTAVDGVLHHGIAIDMMIDGLLSRPYRAE